jgi:hypothetical protein
VGIAVLKGGHKLRLNKSFKLIGRSVTRLRLYQYGNLIQSNALIFSSLGPTN